MTTPDTSRRNFLKASASTATAIGLTSSLVPDLTLAEDCTATNEYPWIDAHSHIWTRDLENYPLANGKTLEDLDPPSFTTEELLEVAHKNDVGKVVLIAHNQFYRWDNSYMIDAAKQHPQALRIVGMVDNMAPHPDLAMKKLLSQNVTGFRITPGVYGRDKWLDNPGMHAMWKMAAQTRQNMCCLINPEDLPTIDKWCRKYADTPVVIDHFARIGIDGTMRKSDIDNLCKLARHRHVTVKISAYYALGKKQPPHTELIPMIERLIAAFGVERLMWASDSPYQLIGENTYSDSINLIGERMESLSTGDREWLLRKTAERVFFFV